MTPGPVAVLTWNLFHGRDHPPERDLSTWRSRLLRRTEHGRRYAQVNRDLSTDFASVLDGWEWDVALLQEVPPAWLASLGRACRSHGALALTSRNQLAPLRRLAARMNPDLIASHDGGANVLLVRAPGQLTDVQRVELTRRPERRTLLLARVRTRTGLAHTVANMHLSVPATGRGAAEALVAARVADDYARGGPLVFGGDLNLRPAHAPTAFAELAERFGLNSPPTGPHAIDHLLVRGLGIAQPPRPLPASAREVAGPRGLRLRLSDHAPVRIAVVPQ